MIRIIRENIGKYKIFMILSPILVLFEVALEIIVVNLLGGIIDTIDAGLTTENMEYVYKISGLMALMAVISLVLGIFASRCAVTASTGLAANLGKRTFDKIQRFSFANTDKFSSASLVTRLTKDMTNIMMSFQLTIRLLIRAPSMLIFSIISAIIINARLAIIFVIAVPFLSFSFFFIAYKAFPKFTEMLKKYDKMNATIQENLIAAREVKAFVREKHENERFVIISNEVKDMTVKAEKLLIFNAPLMQFTMYCCLLAVAWFGGKIIIENYGNVSGLKTGGLTQFIMFVMQVLTALTMIANAGVIITVSSASIKRVKAVLDEKIDIEEHLNADFEVADGSIQLNHVYFSYKKDHKQPTLKNINLHIKSGEKIGIIGGTGSAKTTLVQLIPRLYDVDSGEILVGGRNVKEYNLRILRNQVSMVLQKNVLFSGTIKDNLLWGNKEASDEEINSVAKIAAAHDFITSFPDGYDTYLEHGGSNLSGGQRQRLCIARALLKKPKIIIFDDSTSAVDTKTDHSIQQGIKDNINDTTVIIIAQRISSVKNLDRIIVMDQGSITAIGSHEDLLKTSEIYREVYHSQVQGGDGNEK